MSNYYIVKEKEGMIWLDIPEPITMDFRMIDDFDGSQMFMYPQYEEAMKAYNSRLHYPYDKKLFDWKEGQRVQFGVDFCLDLNEPQPCYKPTTVIAIPLPSKEQEGWIKVEDDTEIPNSIIQTLHEDGKTDTYRVINGTIYGFDCVSNSPITHYKIKHLMDEKKEQEEKTEWLFCNICGGKLAIIRGRYPKDPNREICPTCTMEKLESIESQSQLTAKNNDNI